MSPSRIESNPTAWPKIRYWQHTLNHMDRLGILGSDLCVMMDGLDVFPIQDPKRLHEVYKSFFADSKEGIMFAGDHKCHPFCQEEGCWKWGNGHVYKTATGKDVRGEEMCERMAELSPEGPAKYVCGGLFAGRCSLVRTMLNRVDEVIKEDGMVLAGEWKHGEKEKLEITFDDDQLPPGMSAV